MSNSSSTLTNPSTMTDVDFFRAFDGATISTTVTDGDWTDVDNLLHQGYIVTRTVIIL